MKTYRGYTDAGAGTGPALVTVTNGTRTRPLKHQMRHSPTGFSWGYGGSGPAELARSIRADYLGTVPEQGVYQAFKRAFIARWPIGEAWTLSEAEIAAWLVTQPAAAADEA